MFTLHNGDCLEYMKTLQPKSFDCIVTDPPYGVNMLRGDSTVIGKIHGDLAPPDIKWMADYPAVIFGGNNFCDQLPRSTGWLVWFKYAGEESEHSQAELAWTNCVKTIRHYSEQYTGFMRQREGQWHPTQKPTGLMRWCISKMKLEPGATIFDPYMGSGTTGIAAVQMGLNFIGCEISPEYFAIAEKRIKQAALQPSLFTPSNNRLHRTGGDFPVLPSQSTLEGFTTPEADTTPPASQ